MINSKDGREVEIFTVDGDVGEGAWATDAVYTDTGEYVGEDVLDYLTDVYQAEIYDRYYQNQVSRAEAYSEGMER